MVPTTDIVINCYTSGNPLLTHVWRNRSLFTETACRRNESTSDPFHSLSACLVISYYRPEKINARQQKQFISIKITTGTLSTKINIIYKGMVVILGLVL